MLKSLLVFLEGFTLIKPSSSADSEPARETPRLMNSLQIREWALQQFSEDDFAAGIQEIKEAGGVALSEFVHKLEEIISPDERATEK
jgi:hypothetical protein